MKLKKTTNEVLELCFLESIWLVHKGVKGFYIGQGVVKTPDLGMILWSYMLLLKYFYSYALKQHKCHFKTNEKKKITVVMSQHKIRIQTYNFLIESCFTQTNNKIPFRGSASLVQKKIYRDPLKNHKNNNRNGIESDWVGETNQE